jgi:transcriptional regulator with XRE-family HTH domain
VDAGASTPSSEPPLSFGGLLQHHRLSAGLSQEELAERAGLSRRGISDLERGLRRAPYLATIRRLAEALGLSEPDRVRLLAASRQMDTEPTSASVPLTAAAAVLDPSPSTESALPRQLTSFVGRDRELLQLWRQLTTNPLLTLTGPGGVGKTRLAVRFAEQLLPHYRDGIWFVELAGLSDAHLVLHVVAATLGVVERPDRPLLETVLEHVASKHALLVLDNCEHLVMACALLAQQLLGACSKLQIITTSRLPLRIAGETIWQVQPLALPNLDDTLDDAAATETV